jgi:hypothetical protein
MDDGSSGIGLADEHVYGMYCPHTIGNWHLAVPYGGLQDTRLQPKYIQHAAPLAVNTDWVAAFGRQ